MRTKIAISLFLVFLFVSCVDAPQKSSDILGAWKLISYKYGDGKLQFAPDSVQKIKLITLTHFTWVHFMSKDQIVRSSAGGKYVLDGANYTESIDFGGPGMTPYFNKRQVFKIKIENGKMYLSGNLSDQLKIEETWEKL